MSRSQRTTAPATTWRDVRASLDKLDRVGLIGLVRDLYNVDALNRRVLHARFAQNSATFSQYRRLVRAAVFPDPLSQRPIRLRDATATIREYQRATGDLTGVVDLMLEFVEAGTEQAADLGYGDDAYFSALERKVNDILRLLDNLPHADRGTRVERLARLREYQGAIGWGYGDFLADVATQLHGCFKRSRCRKAV